MPLARIFTRNPERTADLSSQLQQQGYKIEVVSPDLKHLAPADLEIEFEICERADLLERASDLASELEADVAIAPGILQPIAKPAVQPTASAAAILSEMKFQEIFPTNSESTSLKPDAEREFEAAFAASTETTEASDIVEIPVMEHAPLPPVAFADAPDTSAEQTTILEPVRIAGKQNPVVTVPVHFSEPSSSELSQEEPILAEPVSFASVTEPAPKAPAHYADPVPYLAQLTPFGSPAARQEQAQMNVDIPAESRQPELNQSAQASDKSSRAAERSKQVLNDGAKIAAKTWAEALALTSSTADTVRDQFRIYKKKAQVRSAEQRAAQAARMLDLEQRQAEAQQRAAELEAARIAASARLNELLQNRAPGLNETGQREQSLRDQNLRDQSSHEKDQPEHGLWQPSTYAHTVIQDDVKREVPRTKPAPPARVNAKATIKTTPAALWGKVTPPFRAVLTGAAAVSALFVMGIALGLFHSGSPMASPANHNSASQSANNTTAPTGDTAQTKDAPQAVAQTSQPESAAKSAPGQPAQQASSKQTSSDQAAADSTLTAAKAQAPAKPSPRQHAVQIVAEQSERTIGDDVVIRHFSRPVPTQQPKQAGQQAGLKHFSDLDN